MKSMEPVGKIEYGYGDEQTFYDTEKYIQAFKEALYEMGPMSVKAKTFTRDPAAHKAIDDLIWGEFGEENPNDPDYYKMKNAEASGERAEQQPEPELDEDLEL